MHTHTFTTTSIFPDLEVFMAQSLGDKMCKGCHLSMVEAVEPFKLHPTSMTYMCKVFEHNLLMWMGIQMHTKGISITTVSEDLGEVVETLCHESAQTKPLCYGWNSRTFQTATYIHTIHI